MKRPDDPQMFVAALFVIFFMGVLPVTGMIVYKVEEEAQRSLSDSERIEAQTLIETVGGPMISAAGKIDSVGHKHVVADCGGAQVSFAWPIERNAAGKVVVRPNRPIREEAHRNLPWDLRAERAAFTIPYETTHEQAQQALRQAYGTASPWCDAVVS